ncbi:unnamed protein product [Leptidea sinapis]|uniref:Carboxylesterase type B domain-containing protein n=1 Tax=Leptidea sinapis TaxID=189913 RepID=A0A5E4PSG8_9NEOP|nr:unnamed protein product [Leptidea sinapis]
MRMKEYCLIANLFVPDTKENNLPVVVNIHGGGFQICYGNLNTYKNLIRSKRIIIETFNYRLGPFGFLCLGTKDAPGYAGMKDQVALLRWVNQNIAEFDGNPEDVTIDGYSAGSSSVDLLMLSESARGLFHKAIPESGAGIAAFSVQTDPKANAMEYAKLLNYTGSGSVADLEKYYKSLSYELLVSVNKTKNPFQSIPIEAGHNQIYLYEFPFAHDQLDIIPHTNIRRAGHCSQTNTVSDGSATFNYTNSKLIEMRNLTRSIWLNFITTGKPISEDSELPPWPPVGKNWSPHMSLDLPLSLRGSLLKERTHFWDEIYKEHYQQPIPPSTAPAPRYVHIIHLMVYWRGLDVDLVTN